VADRLIESAKRGHKSLAQLTEAGEEALAQLDAAVEVSPYHWWWKVVGIQ
jgi:hypothetical protein